jgi:hypothetical protein
MTAKRIERSLRVLQRAREAGHFLDHERQYREWRGQQERHRPGFVAALEEKGNHSAILAWLRDDECVASEEDDPDALYRFVMSLPATAGIKTDDRIVREIFEGSVLVVEDSIEELVREGLLEAYEDDNGEVILRKVGW